MRLFLAADLSDAQRQAVSRAAGRLRREVERGAGDGRGVTWVNAANLHVTLHFLGDVDEPRLPGLLGALARPLATPSFEMGLGRFGVFPPSGEPRVIWVGITPGDDALSAVHRELAARISAAGFEVEGRPFRTHVTVGRVKRPVGDVLRHLAAGTGVESASVGVTDHVTLYRSDLRPAGPVYEPRLRMPLS